ncbi:conjugative transposon protein TraN [Longitalea luteola]|uniref:conjugative transposon protein TraN n=1 Tax=Longitalea luteola TaxID=2812563 RepID=UPI001A9710C9|nr:conjugative transposon protein TraN [Longitalea luteola]
MKQVVMLILVSSISLFAWSQPVVLHMGITTDKTTSLLFPAAIRHVDLGTPDVLAEQVKEAENLVLVKAGQANFKETNLTVVTADGRLYSFRVVYDPAPSMLVHRLSPSVAANNANIAFHGELMKPQDLEAYCKGILDNHRMMRGIVDASWDAMARVDGIYIKDNVIFYQLLLDNHSTINYDVDFIRFYIHDKKKSKRTAAQEIELKPLYIAGNVKSVEGMSRNTVSVAFEKFTLPDAKYLAIEIMEKNGGRHLSLKVSNRKIVRAQVLPDLQ